MATPRRKLDAFLFLPAMAGLAAAVGAGMLAVIAAGWGTAIAWYWLFRDLLALPHSPALSLTVMATPLTLYAALRWIAKRL